MNDWKAIIKAGCRITFSRNPVSSTVSVSVDASRTCQEIFLIPKLILFYPFISKRKTESHSLSIQKHPHLLSIYHMCVHKMPHFIKGKLSGYFICGMKLKDPSHFQT
jgi:hypothetical protein